ncbi:hypothetical protein [Micromonospora narathiwatensis]|uniref:DUF6311 domain-containing protein n=1 Tax=Micromonospora narathiwatensis TaxID=299146 RepID=A0A1A8Z5K2_9ACTN|nr:hypothetical protein [Micromonospora narathiwatensis]SBT39215.1 hypothetical protein GA0070621_0619 [Micromonospora narathiwatensis]
MTASGPDIRSRTSTDGDAVAETTVTDVAERSETPGATGPDAPVEARATARRRRIRLDLLVAAVYVAGALWVTGRGWLDHGGRLLGSRPNDQGFNEWMLAYAAHAVSHLENPFFTTLQNAPNGVNLMTNVGMQLPGLVLAPVTLLFGASFSYLLFITLNLAGTGYAWYHVLSRHVVSSRVAAFGGGLFCAFAPALVSHSNGHPHITAQWLVPFIVWRVVRLARDGRPVRDGLVLGALVVTQFFVSLEILFLVALGCLMMVLGYLICRPREALRRARPMLGGLAITGVLVGAAAAYPLWMQFAGPQHRIGHPGNPDVYALTLGSFVRYATESVAGSPTSALRWGPNTTEQASFYGWSVVVLALAACWWLRREVIVRVITVVAVISAAFSIGTTWTVGTRRTSVPAPFALVTGLPVFDSVVVARFALITTVALGVLLAVAGDRLAKVRVDAPAQGRLVPRLAAVAVFAALLPILPTPLEARGRVPVPDFVTGGAWREHVAPGRTLVPVPVDGMTSLYWSSAALTAFAVPSGYFLGPVSDTDATGRWGVEPQPTAKLLTAVSQGERAATVSPVEIDQARADVRYWKADAVALPDRARRHDDLKIVLDAMFGPGQRVDDVWVWDVRSWTR